MSSHQGDDVLFVIHNRPVRGSKGHYRVNMRHGVNRIRAGMRHTAGIIPPNLHCIWIDGTSFQWGKEPA